MSDNEEESTWRNARLIFNIGGQHHEAFVSTLKAIPNTRLAWIADNYHALQQSNFFDPVKKEFYFDRSSACFAAIVNYFQTGQLHYPANICGPMFEIELKFWGIDETQMNSCCWTGYTVNREKDSKVKWLNEGPQLPHCCCDRNHRTGSIKKLCILKNQFYQFLNNPYSSKAAMIKWYFGIGLLILYVTMPMVSSIIKERHGTTDKIVNKVEIFLSIYYTVELLLMLFLCPDKKSFLMDKMNVVDLITLVPGYLEFATSNHNVHIYSDLLTLFRSIKAFRPFRYNYTMQVLVNTLKASIPQLLLMTFLLLLLATMFAFVCYYVEGDLRGTKFKSIPHCLWWAFITMTTVGYGDMYPRSWLGLVVGVMCAISGLLMVVLPVSVVATNFSIYYNYAKARKSQPPKQRFKPAKEANMLIDDIPAKKLYSGHSKTVGRQLKASRVKGRASRVFRNTFKKMKSQGLVKPSLADVVLSSKGDWKTFSVFD